MKKTACFFHSSTHTWLAVVLFYFFFFLVSKQEKRDTAELIFQGLWFQRPLAALQTFLQNPRALKTPGYNCTNLEVACAEVSHSAACATCLHNQAAICLPAKPEAEVRA